MYTYIYIYIYITLLFGCKKIKRLIMNHIVKDTIPVLLFFPCNAHFGLQKGKKPNPKYFSSFLIVHNILNKLLFQSLSRNAGAKYNCAKGFYC